VSNFHGVGTKIANDLRTDIKAARKIRPPWWSVVCGIIGSFFCAWLFDSFGKLNLVLPTLNSIAVLGFILVLKWNLRWHAWFWITIAVIAALHVPLVLLVPWSTRWVPALAIAVIDSADLIVILTIVSVVARFVGHADSNDVRRAF
jgi:hypothetical protein